MAGTTARTMGSNQERTNDRQPCLRPVVPGVDQFPGLHHLRLQLRQAPEPAGLALLRRLLGLPGGVVHRDVWVSPDDLPPLRLAYQPLSGSGLVRPRFRPPPGNALRLAGESPLWALPPPQH